jgi:hypothetical protein
MDEGEVHRDSSATARAAARRSDRDRRQALTYAMRAGWNGEDADESNWLDSAIAASPDPAAAARTFFGLASRLITELAAVTGEDPTTVLKRHMV